MYLDIFVGRNGDVFYVSLEDHASPDCSGSISDPCASLSSVIQKSQSGDTIQIHPKASGGALSCCDTKIVNMNLTIEGASNQTIISCDGNKDRNILHITNATVSLINITLMGGYISAKNSHLRLYDCMLDDTSLLLMDEESLALYQKTSIFTTIKDRVDHIHRNQSSKQWMQDESFCSHIKVVLVQVTWTHADDSEKEDIYLDTLINDGIQSICSDISIEISDLADRQILAYSLVGLNFTMTHSIFQGLSHGRNIAGGIRIYSYAPPDVTIQHSLFSGLRYSNYFHAIFSAQHFANAAVAMHLLNDEKASSKTFLIQNTTFEDNCRALLLSTVPRVSDFYNVVILDSTFNKNTIMTDGGAMMIESQGTSLLNITLSGSYFDDNKAGVPSLGYPKYSEKPITITKEPRITINSFEILEDDSLKLYMEFVYTDQAPVSQAVYLGLAGNGGAIYADSAKLNIIG